MSTLPVAGRSDVVVLGAGPAGLAAAILLRQAGHTVTLIHKGLGGWQLSQGTIDVLGYAPDLVDSPFETFGDYAAAHPEHPYASISADAVRRGIQWLVDTLGPDMLAGDPDHNVLLPTAVGAVRPTALATPSMVQGACVDGAKFVIVGPKQLKDFHPALVAKNLTRTTLPGGGHLEARDVLIDFEARAGEVDSNALNYARAFDDPARRRELVAILKGIVHEGETVGLPAFLGLDDHSAWRDVQDQLGQPVFEIPLPPPGVPGMRINRTLMNLAKRSGVRVVLGSFVQSALTDGDRVEALVTHAAGGPRAYYADHFVFAPGGFESGALTMDSHGGVAERIMGLPLAGLDDTVNGELVHGDYWGDPQPLFRVGVRVDPQMRVLDADGTPAWSNLYAAGGILGGATRWQEKSGEGIALGSAVAAVDAIVSLQPVGAASTSSSTVEGEN